MDEGIGYHTSLMAGVLARLLGVLTTGLFAAYLIALSPHLVHHVFDDDHGVPACPLLAQGQQTPQLQPDPPSLPLPSKADTVLASRVESPLLPPVPPPSDPRAPPRSELPA